MLVTTVVGDGAYAVRDGVGLSASCSDPYGLALDARGCVAMLTEIAQHVVRFVDLKTFTIRTVAGLAGHRGMQDGQGEEARFASHEE